MSDVDCIAGVIGLAVARAMAFYKSARPTSLMKRFATTEEVAAMVTFVASPLSAATNGAALRVDGGVIKSAF